MINYTMINAMTLPNYDIISIFKDENDIIFVKRGNFKFFVDKQIEFNCPGKYLIDINNWLSSKFNYGSLDWNNGVSLGEDFIFEHSIQVF